MKRFTILVMILCAASTTAVAQASTYNILHSFVGGASDGATGNIGVVSDGSTLFGMTEGGGANNKGTIYKIGTDGIGFSILHSFAGGSTDGLAPMGGLIRSGSTLYGMTGWGGGIGGNDGRGTVFKMQTDGSGFDILHAFAGGGSDGQGPAYSRLALSGNTLYGMTEYGGSNSDLGKGTIFKVNIDGSGYTVLHAFAGGIGDGADPHGGLTVVGDTLYGMTKAGGTGDYGTLFKIGVDGSGFDILHSFGANTSGGVWPCGDLTLSGTTLYGTAQQGGGHSPYGTIFKIDISGENYGVLHNFDYNNPNDAAYSVGSLTVSGQTLYGTAGSGINSSGILFQMNTDGTGFTRLHAFQGGTTDGKSPGEVLTLDNGVLYSTTWWGGSSANNGYGYGTVYSFAVPEPSTLVLFSIGACSLLGYTCRWRKGRARRSPKKTNLALRRVAVASLASLVLFASSTQADVFDMGGTRNPVTGTWTGLASLDTVLVGDAGNVADTTGYGAVAYNYSIGKYDVTNAQYCEFLNAKASASDPNTLWNSYMSSDAQGGIARSASAPTRTASSRATTTIR